MKAESRGQGLGNTEGCCHFNSDGKGRLQYFNLTFNT